MTEPTAVKRILTLNRRFTSHSPSTRLAAPDQALGLVRSSPRLALAILIGDCPCSTKRAVIKSLRAQMTFPPVHSAASDLVLPPFFRHLAAQPKAVVSQVHQLWSSSRPHAGSPVSQAEHYLQTVSDISRYSVFYHDSQFINRRASQTAVGYLVILDNGEVTSHKRFYFATGCRIDGLTFDYRVPRAPGQVTQFPAAMPGRGAW
jgi:hypothetical protein